MIGNRSILLADADALNDVSVTVPYAFMFKPATRTGHIHRRRVIGGVITRLGHREYFESGMDHGFLRSP